MGHNKPKIDQKIGPNDNAHDAMEDMLVYNLANAYSSKSSSIKESKIVDNVNFDVGDTHLYAAGKNVLSVARPTKYFSPIPVQRTSWFQHVAQQGQNVTVEERRQ